MFSYSFAVCVTVHATMEATKLSNSMEWAQEMMFNCYELATGRFNNTLDFYYNYEKKDWRAEDLKKVDIVYSVGEYDDWGKAIRIGETMGFYRNKVLPLISNEEMNAIRDVVEEETYDGSKFVIQTSPALIRVEKCRVFLALLYLIYSTKVDGVNVEISENKFMNDDKKEQEEKQEENEDGNKNEKTLYFDPGFYFGWRPYNELTKFALPTTIATILNIKK